MIHYDRAAVTDHLDPHMDRRSGTGWAALRCAVKAVPLMPVGSLSVVFCTVGQPGIAVRRRPVPHSWLVRLMALRYLSCRRKVSMSAIIELLPPLVQRCLQAGSSFRNTQEFALSKESWKGNMSKSNSTILLRSHTMNGIILR
ncbi:hypothetical protein J6590_000117 [Homalodisca vitripennis]|nr:hypothetical protein J6590_000117 [Homalodisca vitripennis]